MAEPTDIPFRDAERPSQLVSYFAADPALRPRYDWLRRHAAGVVGSNYDVHDECNLRCEGCLYFAGADRDGHGAPANDGAWATLFAAEKRRGVNFAYLAGGEPGLAPRRLALAAEHIGRGVVFTNGTVRIDERLPFIRHVSIWGDRAESTLLRGADSYEKAFRLHGGSAHTRFVMTVNATNVDSAWRVAERCRAAGSPLSFSLFSPTEQYRAQLASGAANDDAFFRVSAPDAHLIPGTAQLIEIRAVLDAVAARYPDTVVYRPAYGRWVTDPAGLYAIDPATGWATDCGTRRTARHRHYRADLSSSVSKCCSPNIDCKGCRAYSMATGTAISRFRRFAATLEGFRDWLDIAEQWAFLFLGKSPGH